MVVGGEAGRFAGWSERTAVIHARPDDYLRSSVELSLCAIAVAENIELGQLPTLREIDYTVLARHRVEIISHCHGQRVLSGGNDLTPQAQILDC